MPSEVTGASLGLPLRSPPHDILRAAQDGHHGPHAGGCHSRRSPDHHHGLCRDLQESVF